MSALLFFLLQQIFLTNINRSGYIIDIGIDVSQKDASQVGLIPGPRDMSVLMRGANT